MTSQAQQAREVFAEAGITGTGDPVEPVKEAPAPEPVEDKVEEVETEQPESDEVIEETETEAAPEPEAAEAADSYTVDSLAEAIGFETKELYEMLKVPMKDGQDAIPLGEIKTKFTDVSRENDTLKTQLTDMQGQLEMAKSGGPVGINNEMAQAQAYIQQLQAGMNTEEMKELKEIDPTRYLIESNDIKENIQQAHTYINQLNQKQQLDNQTMMTQFNAKYVELIPSWSDASVKEKDQTVMRSYMAGKGWSDAEINQMVDPRIQVIIKELMDLRAEKSIATDAVKQVRKAPKMISKSRLQPKASKTSEVDKIVKRQRTNPSKQNELAAAKAIWNGV